MHPSSVSADRSSRQTALPAEPRTVPPGASLVVERVALLPDVPAVYAMYGGRGSGAYVAYVGIADKLKARATQHLVRRDSSVTTGVAAVGLNPDHVSELRWWTDPAFAARPALEAAELVAFEVFDPALRSRGRIGEPARAVHADAAFRERMRSLLSGPPSGRLVLPTLHDALERIADLERRLSALEREHRPAFGVPDEPAAVTKAGGRSR